MPAGAGRGKAGLPMAEFRCIDSDDVTPSEIEHRCEEIFDGEALEQRYDYIVYHFECDDRYFWARAYTHEIDAVSVHGPFDRRDQMKKLAGPPDAAVLAYLRRRFRKVETLVDGAYVTVP
jgi:hypothetical protein